METEFSLLLYLVCVLRLLYLLIVKYEIKTSSAFDINNKRFIRNCDEIYSSCPTK